jgi:hypothetical protein
VLGQHGPGEASLGIEHAKLEDCFGGGAVVPVRENPHPTPTGGVLMS